MVTETTSEELIIQYQAGDASALDKLLALNHDYIAAVAKRYAKCGDPDERMQLARIALFHSARLFDVTRGVKFNTYLWMAVKNKVIRWRLMEERQIRPPGMAKDDALPLIEILASRTPTPLQEAMANEQRADEYLSLQLRLSRLRPRDRLVMELRFKGKTLRQIGRKLKLSTERIRQLEKRAMDEMTR